MQNQHQNREIKLNLHKENKITKKSRLNMAMQIAKRDDSTPKSSRRTILTNYELYGT